MSSFKQHVQHHLTSLVSCIVNAIVWLTKPIGQRVIQLYRNMLKIESPGMGNSRLDCRGRNLIMVAGAFSTLAGEFYAANKVDNSIARRVLTKYVKGQWLSLTNYALIDTLTKTPALGVSVIAAFRTLEGIPTDRWVDMERMNPKFAKVCDQVRNLTWATDESMTLGDMLRSIRPL